MRFLIAQWPWSQASHLELALVEAHTVQEHKCESGCSPANQLVGLATVTGGRTGLCWLLGRDEGRRFREMP